MKTGLPRPAGSAVLQSGSARTAARPVLSAPRFRRLDDAPQLQRNAGRASSPLQLPPDHLHLFFPLVSLTLINGISAITKLFSARKTHKITSILLIQFFEEFPHV